MVWPFAAVFLPIVQQSFLPHYLQIASRKLLLFHGRRYPPRHKGGSGSNIGVRLCDLVNSPVMAELQELLLLGPTADQERDMFNNWFSGQVCAANCACVVPQLVCFKHRRIRGRSLQKQRLAVLFVADNTCPAALNSSIYLKFQYGNT